MKVYTSPSTASSGNMNVKVVRLSEQSSKVDSVRSMVSPPTVPGPIERFAAKYP